MQNKVIKKHFSKKLGLNRTLFARIFDLAIIAVLLSFVVFVLVYLSYRKLAPTLIITLACATLFMMVFLKLRNKKLDKYIKDQMAVMTKNCALEKLVLLSDENFRTIVKLYLKDKNYTYIKPNVHGFKCKDDDIDVFVTSFQRHYSQTISAQDILNSFKLMEKKNAQRLIILSLCERDSDAKKLIDKLPADQICFLSTDDVIKVCENHALLPDQDEVMTYVLSEITSERKTLDQLKKEMFHEKKPKAYIILGITIMLWSYFTGFKFYYPIIAMVCFALAFFSFKNKKGKEAAKV